MVAWCCCVSAVLAWVEDGLLLLFICGFFGGLHESFASAAQTVSARVYQQGDWQVAKCGEGGGWGVQSDLLWCSLLSCAGTCMALCIVESCWE